MQHQARKRFGQNFLRDHTVIDRIVRAVNPRPGERVVEIGPGLGALTGPLLQALGRLDVVELDRDLIPHLQEKFAGAGELRIHQADALRFDFRTLAGPGEPLRVVGNLPYNISTPLIFHLIEQADVIRDMHFMLQKEVVDRLAAAPDTADYGRLSVMVQYYCKVERLFMVPPGAFHPVPKVDSAVVRLVPYREAPVQVNDQERFARLVAQAFSQRRKTLRNTLRGWVAAETMAALDIDPGRRAETLTLAEFAALANAAGESPG
ncbi:MAG: 16S rRNA (adenine(1518)-N(6)/adenine(1519)-N(6))-dimethyltransferase RsmA [Thiohalomonadaceae bacterium]